MPKYTVPTEEEREIILRYRPDLNPDDFMVEFRCEGRLVLLEKKKRELLRDVTINFKEEECGNKRKDAGSGDQRRIQGRRVHRDHEAGWQDSFLDACVAGGN